ncbi:ABC transporter substrate-binding protein [Enterovirga rhinocerotis]|uniref:Amino acid/amide ABC transporter substrate-binding protein (HAAT family) n=1 Tax=Enterovirga rhinocerotis TaxID=1339210 RepID=A0A4R7C9B2_9HYPH|nr:ABC transporter substrate-binding protein [Enterovirga rhinocerotis]TDR94883.1 amino acid/amide ABC transporter substrate-binding protein (HAAT family) [Enterovirga rhinocerotis]
MRLLTAACALGALAFATGVSAQTVKVGMTVSTTGPAASLGIPEANTAKLYAKEIGGVPVEVVVLDDGSDTTKGVANTRKLLTDDKADVIIGSSTTPVSLAMIEVVSDIKAPMISLAASAAIVSPMDEKRRWVFKTPQNDRLMADAIADHMKGAGVKKVAFIGFNDAYGDGWLNVFGPAAKSRGIELVATERYARSDTSVTGPILKVMAAKPDVVLVAGSGTPAALPQKTLKERGFKGVIYQTHGAANGDFLRVGGKDVEGTILPAGPVLVAAQLPDSNPTKKAGLEYTKQYEAMFGAGTTNTFGAHANDAFALLAAALPVATKTAKPGTPEFRAALRDALEGLKDVVYSQGVVTMTKDDHVGQDKRARVMVTIENGAWKLLPEATQ